MNLCLIKAEVIKTKLESKPRSMINEMTLSLAMNFKLEIQNHKARKRAVAKSIKDK